MAREKQPEKKPEKQENTQQTRSLYQEGPQSIEGVEARDLPDKGRGSLETIAGKELGRKVPSRTGAGPGNGTDVGLRGTPDVADASDHGHWKHV